MFYFYIIRLAIFLNLYFYAEKKDRVVKFELLSFSSNECDNGLIALK